MKRTRPRAPRSVMRIVLFALLVGCAPVAVTIDGSAPDGGLGSGATCSTESTVDYDGFGRPFFATYCTRCHASALVGAARNGAPRGYDWDSITGIRAHAAEIDRQAAVGPHRANRFMPPNGAMPSDQERAQLGEWLACGAP